MREAVVIFPDQLYTKHPAFNRQRDVFIVEEQLFFADYQYPARFHKKKLMFHHASMHAYYDQLKKQGYRAHYIEYKRDKHMGYLFRTLRTHKIRKIYIAELTDYALEKRLYARARKTSITIQTVPSPSFLNTKQSHEDFFRGKKHCSMTQFYIMQRKKMDILIKNGKPIGGTWSYDPQNRKPLPQDARTPDLPRTPRSTYIDAARKYVDQRFPEHPGACDGFFYPVTHRNAKQWFDSFLEEKLTSYGVYQDAIDRRSSFLFHSVLSPLLNVGLLTPHTIVEKTLHYARHHRVPINSLEGFIRQIIGWREFIRLVYVHHNAKIRTTNFWKHQRALPRTFYTASTGIEPVDTVLQRLLRDAYLNHIERLMVVGNIMLLCRINPDDVYTWFMELFIDAYDWVMVPNVYSMSQYADGGFITTKPYISSSNYIRRMGNFPRGAWCQVWDSLYWSFIHEHRHVLAHNARMRLIIKQLERMKKSTLKQHQERAQTFLRSLDT